MLGGVRWARDGPGASGQMVPNYTCRPRGRLDLAQSSAARPIAGGRLDYDGRPAFGAPIPKTTTMSDKDIREASLEYHRQYPPGKIALLPTKQLTNQRDLALAYTPGVAAACDEIVRDPREAATLTSRQNLVAVVTNGTAVLGLGAIGPLAAKPVMEGKAVLFKKFSGLDCFDIEINELDPDKLVDMIVALEPTFGGINLEDIKAPECFYIEQKCRERMKIPVFHDDQHGTAIIVGAAILNGLRVVGKDLDKVKLVCSGAGAAALACLDLLVGLGIKRENIWVADIKGVVYRGRTELMDDHKIKYAQESTARTLAEILPGADIFLGLSAARVLKPEWLAQMAKSPLILALANPEPEIMPDVAKAARPDAVIATGRSDFPNQVNNVLCFPFIFRGALDVGATTINEADEARVRARDRRSRDGRAVGHRRARVQRRKSALWSRVPDPEAVRSAADRDDCAGGREGGDGLGCRHAADRGLRRVSAAPDAVRLSLRTADEADLRRGEGVAEAHRVRRGRRRARIARRAGRGRRRARAPDSRRPSRGHRDADRALCAAHRAWQGLRHHQSGQGRPLPRLLDRVLPADAAQRRLAGVRADRDAAPAYVDRRDGDASRRRRRHAVRHLWHPRPASYLSSTR